MRAGDIVQITDRGHPWFTALLVVGEVKIWGIKAYCIVPASNKPGPDSTVLMPTRLEPHQFERVGTALLDPEQV